MKLFDYDFEVIMIANERCLSEWSWNSERNGWMGFLLWYVYANGVNISVRGKEYSLSAGDTYIFDLSKDHYCTHDPQKPLAVYSMHLQCEQSVTFAAELESGKILLTQHLPDFELNSRIIDHLLEITDDPVALDVWFKPVLYQFLTPGKKASAKHSAIQKLCAQINRAPQMDYSLESMCRTVGYSKNHFIRLFSEATGMTPGSYIIAAKINKAKSLLLFSDFNITQISNALGYYDVNHFSSQFSLKVGCSPSEYIKRLQLTKGIRLIGNDKGQVEG